MTELIIVTLLLSMLSMIVGTTWIAFGRSAWESVRNSRLTEEAELAVSTLAGDLSGYYPEASSTSDPRDRSRWVGRVQPGGTSLWLCFDGGDPLDGLASWAAPDVVISYTQNGDKLVRFNQATGVSTVVATHVSNFTASDLGNAVQIDLRLTSQGITSNYRFIALDPP